MEFVDNRLELTWYSLSNAPPPRCKFDNERVPLVCSRDNVNKYANYIQNTIQMNLTRLFKVLYKANALSYISNVQPYMSKSELKLRQGENSNVNRPLYTICN